MIRYVAIAGNTVFALWIVYNGINEGLKGTHLEVISYVGLVVLLLLNTVLLVGARRGRA